MFPHSKRVPFSFLILFNFQGPALPCGVAYLLYQICFRLSSLFSDIFFAPLLFLRFEGLSHPASAPAPSDSFVILPHPPPSCQHLFAIFLLFSFFFQSRFSLVVFRLFIIASFVLSGIIYMGTHPEIPYPANGINLPAERALPSEGHSHRIGHFFVIL